MGGQVDLRMNSSDLGVTESNSMQGHEDLRQDERVMQLFGLVNAMLSNDRSTAERDLSIARYAVIPLSPNSGKPQEEAIDLFAYAVKKGMLQRQQAYIAPESLPGLSTKIHASFTSCKYKDLCLEAL